jgi:PelA/Pel-15E family pectate lyase
MYNNVKWVGIICFLCLVSSIQAKKIVVAKDGSGDFSSIQAAIESLPSESKSMRTILIKSGIYTEKIFIDKNNIKLKGETKPVKGSWWSEFSKKVTKEVIIQHPISREIYRCTEKDDDWGAAVINVKANDIKLENLSFVNTYGYNAQGVEYIYCKDALREVKPDGHQFTLRCMTGTQRFEATHCNFYSKGGDTVSPWDVDNGTFYFKNCTMEGGVDLYCPRGWAYAEGCHFLCYNRSAAIWHDGTEYESSKSVLKNCVFEGVDGFKLGRYHRPAHMYLINCSFAENLADADIYATTPTPDEKWGRRIYYYNCSKPGTAYEWYANNLDAKVAKKINRKWTLNERWNTFVQPKSANTFALPISNPVDLQAENMVLVQLSNGGWPKTLDGKIQPIPYQDKWTSEFINDFKAKLTDNDATIDNNATTKEIIYLAKAFEQTQNEKYKNAAEKGISYLLGMQYPNGGFPQYWPETKGYFKHITFNDNAMINVLEVLDDISVSKSPFKTVGQSLKENCKVALQMGIDVILKTQIEYKGVKSIWCAQHDHITLLPAKARAYEHPSFTVSESAGIVKFLMSIPEPTDEIKNAINQAMFFFEKLKIKDTALKQKGESWRDYDVVYEKNAEPLWGRFHHIENLKPIFSGRDGVIKYSVDEIEEERRRGYKWYGEWVVSLYPMYQKWHKKHFTIDSSGLTMIRDTSFTVEKTISDMKKNFPNATYVLRNLPRNITLQKDVIYNRDKNYKVNIFSQKVKKSKGVVILLHGGGWRTGSKEMHQNLAIDLAEEGFLVFSPEYTLSTHGLYPAAVNDIMIFLQWVNDNPIKDKIGGGEVTIMGFSAGAQLASLVAQYPDVDAFYKNVDKSKLPKIKSLINLDGLLSYLHNESGEGDDWLRKSSASYWFGYNKLSRPDIWIEASPLTHAGKKSPPTLFINSGVERMRAGRTEYMNILKENDIYSKELTFNDAPHTFVSFEPWYTPMIQEIVKFLNLSNK